MYKYVCVSSGFTENVALVPLQTRKTATTKKLESSWVNAQDVILVLISTYCSCRVLSKTFHIPFSEHRQ